MRSKMEKVEIPVMVVATVAVAKQKVIREWRRLWCRDVVILLLLLLL